MQNNNTKLWIALGVFFLCWFIISGRDLEARDVKDQIKKGIEDVSDFMKKEVDNISGDIEAVQDYFDHYSWKGVIENHVTSGVATIGHVKLNGHSKAVVVHPGDTIEGEVKCSLDPKKCSVLSFYRVVLGIKGVGPQTTVCNYLGTVAGDSLEKFTLTAPQKTGIYQIRFRVSETILESEAFKEWTDDQGEEPDSSTTIGLIIVK